MAIPITGHMLADDSETLLSELGHDHVNNKKGSATGIFHEDKKKKKPNDQKKPAAKDETEACNKANFPALHALAD